MIGEACCKMVYLPTQETAEMAVTRVIRLVSIAEVLPESERALAGRMLNKAWRILLRAQSSGGVSASELQAVLLRIRDLALIIDSEWLSSDLQYPPIE